MKPALFPFIAASAYIFLLSAQSILAATWTGGGDGSTWMDGANWDTGVAPGTTPADDGENIKNQAILGKHAEVILDNSKGLWISPASPLIQDDSSLTITGAESDEQVNLGNPQVFGTLNINGGQITTSGGGQRTRCYMHPKFTSQVNLNGGRWEDTSHYRVGVWGKPTAVQPGIHVLNISSGTFSTSVTLMEVGSEVEQDHLFSTMTVNGDGATIELLNLSAFNSISNVNGLVLINFQLDERGRVSPIHVSKLLDLNSSGAAGNLAVDITNFKKTFSKLTLFSYGALTGTFGDVEVFYMDGSKKIILESSSYSLDYGRGENDQITLAVKGIR